MQNPKRLAVGREKVLVHGMLRLDCSLHSEMFCKLINP